MVTPTPLRRSSRKRTATQPYYSISNPPRTTQRQTVTKSKKKGPTRDNDEQQSDESPAPQIKEEDTAGPSNRETSRSVSRGRKRTRSDHGHDEVQAGPSNVDRDVSDNRPRKQRAVEASSVIYSSIEVPLTTEGESARAASPQVSGSIGQGSNQENMLPVSEQSTIIVSSSEPEYESRHFRRDSQSSRQSEDEREERVPTEGHEDARSALLVERNDVTTRRLAQVEQLATKNSNTIKKIIELLRENDENFPKIEKEIEALKSASDYLFKQFEQMNNDIDDLKEALDLSKSVQQLDTQSLTRRIGDLEHYAATSSPAAVSNTQSIDARIVERFEEIQRTDPNARYLKNLDDAFFYHFGVRWKQLRNVNKMPDEIYGAYYLRAKAEVRILPDTMAQRDADNEIIQLAEYITGNWLTTIDPKKYPADHLQKMFAALFRKACAREAIGNVTFSRQPGTMPPPPRPVRQLAPSAME